MRVKLAEVGGGRFHTIVVIKSATLITKDHKQHDAQKYQQVSHQPAMDQPKNWKLDYTKSNVRCFHLYFL